MKAAPVEGTEPQGSGSLPLEKAQQGGEGMPQGLWTEAILAVAPHYPHHSAAVQRT